MQLSLVDFHCILLHRSGGQFPGFFFGWLNRERTGEVIGWQKGDGWKCCRDIADPSVVILVSYACMLWTTLDAYAEMKLCTFAAVTACLTCETIMFCSKNN